MKKLIKANCQYTALFLSLCCASISYGNPIREGTYKQTSVYSQDGWGDCASCSITITKITPHIIQIVSNNGWIGYAVYDEGKDKYTGSWEWTSGNGGVYQNKIFDSTLVYDSKVIKIEGVARESGMTYAITYR